MIDELNIDKLIQPVLDRQARINQYVISKILKRVKEIGELLPSDLYSLESIIRSSTDINEINTMLNAMEDLQIDDIEDLLNFVAIDSYEDVEYLYHFRNMDFVPLPENIALQNVVNAIAKQTSNTYVNIAQAQAFMIRDLANPTQLVATPIAMAYQSIVDEAIQAAQSGILDYTTVMRRTTKQLIDSGLKTAVYESENGKTHYQSIDAVVKRNVLDGIREINQGVQDEVGRQVGANGKEITVHACPAPDHCKCQGHQFTNEQWENMQNGLPFIDVQGRKYEGFKRKIGTLNCRHFAYSIIVGAQEQTMSDEQLQAILDNNEKGYTNSQGNHRTLYECTQVMRKYERDIRALKRSQIEANIAGDEQLENEYQAKAKQKVKEYYAFCKDCGLSPRNDNLYVEGYSKL